MGASSVPRYPGESVRDVLKRECEHWDTPDAGLVDVAVVHNKVAYAAIRGREGLVYGEVFLLHDVRKDEISYSSIREIALPNARACPERILKHLSPLDALYGNDPTLLENATTWRDSCWAVIKTRKALRSLKDGDVLRFKRPLTFNDGTVLDTFVFHREKTWRKGTRTVFCLAVETHWGWQEAAGARYRITRWRTRAFEVVGRIGPEPEKPKPKPKIDHLRPKGEGVEQLSLFG